jgi:hypothetical protein
LGQRLDFHVSGHLLELYGVCVQCQTAS